MLIHTILKDKKDFTQIEEMIASYILEHVDTLEKESARHIASVIYTAPSTIVRFCQKIGFQGFNEFKDSFLKEAKYLSSHFQDIDPNYPFESEDNPVMLANKMGQLYKETIDDTLSLLTNESLQKCIQLLHAAKHIYLCSSGIQSELASTFKDKLLKIGKSVVTESKVDEAFYRASYCDKESVFIVISYSGETEILLRVAKKLKERKIASIGITSYGDNTLTHIVSHSLYVSTREKLTYNLGNFTMNISTLYILDVLYTGIFTCNYQNSIENRVNSSREFQISRSSFNPILKDQDT